MSFLAPAPLRYLTFYAFPRKQPYNFEKGQVELPRRPGPLELGKQPPLFSPGFTHTHSTLG